MVKILLTGASGLLGRDIMAEALRRNLEIVGLALTRIGDNLIKCDLTVAEEVTEVINKVKPDVIIHSAAERSPDKVEKHFEKVKELNINTTGFLSELAKKTNCKFLYISTDYVFDGTSPPYKENDPPNPINKYGQTKFEGEKAATASNPQCCILRIPVLYGHVEYLGESAVTCLLSNVKSSEVQFISHRENRYPAATWDIAKIICDLIPHMIEKSLDGIFHWSGKERLTKYDMAVKIAQTFSLPYSHLKPQTEAAASSVSRPLDAHLDSSKLEKLSISYHTPFNKGIKQAIEKLL